MQTNQGKLETLNQAFDVLKIYFRTAPEVPSVNYKTSMRMPEFLFEMFLQEINKMEIQIRIDSICQKLKIKESELKKYMKDYTLQELETAQIKKGKLIITNELNYVRQYED
jgi:hypothetical protein